MNAIKNNKRKIEAESKREWRRLNPSEVPSLKGVLINQGDEARVIDISMGGILLETEFRLRPQMKILLKVVTTKGVLKIDGFVIRSSITSIAKIPIYQSAVVFDKPLSLLDDLEQKPAEQASKIQSQSMTPDISENGFEPRSGQISSDPNLEISPQILTVIAPEKFGAAIDDMISANDW